MILKEKNELNSRLQHLKLDMKHIEEEREADGKWKEEVESQRQLVVNVSSEKAALMEASSRLMEENRRYQQELNQLRSIQDRIEMLEKREAHLMVIIEKLVATEESIEPLLTCMICMNLLNKPNLCVPCGHAYCEACWDQHCKKSGNVIQCFECKKRITDVAHCEMLETLVQKHRFRKQTLETICKASNNLTC
jgi:hypothetical protein